VGPSEPMSVSLHQARSCIKDKSYLLYILLFHFGVFWFFVLSAVSGHLGAAHTVVTIIYLFTVPGTLILIILGEPLTSPEVVSYIPTISLVFLMLIGVSSNVAIRNISQVNKLFRPDLLPFIVWISLSILILILIVRDQSLDPPPIQKIVNEMQIHSALIFLLPLVTVIGSILLTTYRTNFVIIFGIIGAALSGVILYHRRHTRVAALYATALVLLWQSTLVLPYLSGRGDTRHEFYISHLTLIRGQWNPAFKTPKNALPKLTIADPLVSLTTGLPLNAEFKIIYPLLFALIAPTIYFIYRYQFSDKTSYFSALLFIFLPPFFNSLSQSTRTGTALLFVSVYILAVFDNDLDFITQRVLRITFLIGIIFCHYAIAFVFLGILAFVNIYQLMWTAAHRRRGMIVPTIEVGFYSVFLISWYSYTTSETTIQTLIGALYFNLVSGWNSLFVSSSTVRSLSVELHSITYQFIRAEFITLTLVGGITFSVVVLKRLFHYLGRHYTLGPGEHFVQPHSTDGVYIGFVFAGFSLLLISFAPIGNIGINRVYMVAGIFVAPYMIKGILKMFSFVLDAQVQTTLVSWILILMLVMNAGIFATTVTHERSPNPNLSRAWILDAGSDREVFHLYEGGYYTPPSDYMASIWLGRYHVKNSSIYGQGMQSHLLSYFFYSKFSINKPPGEYRALNLTNINCSDGYGYIPEFSSQSGLLIPNISPPVASYDAVSKIPLSWYQLESRAKLYGNGDSNIIQTGGHPYNCSNRGELT